MFIFLKVSLEMIELREKSIGEKMFTHFQFIDNVMLRENMESDECVRRQEYDYLKGYPFFL